MQKIVINTGTLKKAYKRIKDVITETSKITVISNVLFKVTDPTHMELVSTDLENTIIIELELLEETESGLEVLLPFKFSNDALELISADTLTIEVDGNKAVIKGLNDQVTIDKLPEVKEFPKRPEQTEAHTVTVGKDFIHCLGRSLHTVSDSIAVPFMTLVCLDFEKSKVTIVSTTGKALFTKSFEIANKITCQLLLSKKAAKALKAFEETQISWTKNHIFFKCEGITIITTQSEVKYAAWRKVLPAYDANLQLKTNDLVLALKKASLAADPQAGAHMLLKSTIGIINLQAADQKHARDVKADVIGDYHGDCERISYNPSTFLSLLDQVDFEEVHLAIMAENKPVLISSPADPTYLGMLMPIALNDKK